MKTKQRGNVNLRCPISGLPLALVLALTLLAPAVAIAQETVHARVSYDAHTAMVKGQDDADWSYATINTIILPGDTLWVDKEGTLELEISGGSFLRMADGSKATIQALPPSGRLNGWMGSFYVQRSARSTGDLMFESPVCQTWVDRDSQVRFDILGNGATTVSVRWGRATIRCEGGGDVVVGRGMRSYIDPGYLPSEPAPFDLGAEDDFDAWNRERARLLAVGTDSIPKEVTITSEPIGLADLSPYGEWIYVDSSWYWHPTVVVDFIPYRYGHWSFVPSCGYVWVGDYPFSYVTCHYGRWWHHDTHGWLWAYRDTWGPAWVASLRYGPNFVWCPLDPWDSPCVIAADYFNVGGLRFGLYASTYCVADELFLGPCVVRPCTMDVIRHIPLTEINIWNINIRTHGRSIVPYRDAAIQVRDYAPRRVIRGPETIGPAREVARTRVAALEGTDRPSTRFRSIPSSETHNIRTAVDAPTRIAQPRSVRVDQAALSEARRLSGRSVATTIPSTGERSQGIRRGTERVLVPSQAGSRTLRPESDLPRPMRSRTTDAARSGRASGARPETTIRERRAPSTGSPDVTVPAPRSRSIATRAPQTRTSPEPVELPSPRTRVVEPSAPPRSVPPSPGVRTRTIAPESGLATRSAPPSPSRSRVVDVPPSRVRTAEPPTPELRRSEPSASRVVPMSPPVHREAAPMPEAPRMVRPEPRALPEVRAPSAPAPMRHVEAPPSPAPSGSVATPAPSAHNSGQQMRSGSEDRSRSVRER